MLEELVTITKFFSLGEAKLAQGKLVSSGITAFVCDENMHAMNIGVVLGGVRLQVPDSQVVRALEILDNFEVERQAVPEPGDDDDEEEVEEVDCCPECESLEIREMPTSQPRQIALWSAAIPFPEPPATPVAHRWKCLMCGYEWREDE